MENITNNSVYIYGSVNGPVAAVNNGTMESTYVSNDKVQNTKIRPDLKNSSRKSHILLQSAFDIQMAAEFNKIIDFVEQAIAAENAEASPDMCTLLYAKMFLVHYYLTDRAYYEKAFSTIDDILSVDITKRDTKFYCTVLLEKAKLLAYTGKIIQARATLNLVEKDNSYTKDSLYFDVSGSVSFLEGNLAEAEKNYRSGMDNALGEYSTAATQEEKDSCYQHYWAFLTFLGDVYRKIQRPDLALSMWKRAIDVSLNFHFEQKSAECLLAYSECLLQYEKWYEACEYLDMAFDTIKCLPNLNLKYQYYNLKASAFLGIGDSNSAIDSLVELLNAELPPTAAINVLQRIAALEASQGRQEKALSTLNSAKQIAAGIPGDLIQKICNQERDLRYSSIFLDGKVHHAMCPPEKNDIQQMISQFHTSEVAIEKLALAFDIGMCLIDSDAHDADTWLTKAAQIAHNLGNSYAEARVFIAKSRILFSLENEQAEIDARHLIEQSIELMHEIPIWDIRARSMMFKGMSEAHNEKYKEALECFIEADEILSSHNINDQILSDYISDFTDICREILSKKQYTDLDFDTIFHEISFFNAWMPKYRNEMIQFLWYNRHEDIERLIISSHGSKALMVSDSAAEINMWSKQLSFLFDTVSYCSQTDYHTEENWNFAHFLPVPQNMVSKFFNVRVVMNA